MIETREQYEELMNRMQIQPLPASGEAIRDTIEALRDVAKAAEEAEFALSDDELLDDDARYAAKDRLAERPKLPDWLTE